MRCQSSRRSDESFQRAVKRADEARSTGLRVRACAESEGSETSLVGGGTREEGVVPPSRSDV